ncbi:MAG TPA: thiamine pyrophosphate-binding protein [Methanothermobacter sp.]|nr:thiamine pyrophosphate [Methanothermobacter sp. MT-2]HHW05190.1 thiamine pyrophosphate-binding protein [Methanothermobacter sp.]HOK73437.1 thiamine pyrophosphate-binding protein [Methanothermobacter sp.]HOL69712.1 thiamine pyrophosphate-binding protein [Methanothermobacter sp.]HPQ05300.1 thiamine pyrophosphate-binding protein [Methanothermobacter sp.]
MAEYRCTVCNYVYSEKEEKKRFSELPDDWRCPVCNAPKSLFVKLTPEKGVKPVSNTVADVFIAQMIEWGVKYVFGIPGTSALGLVDALRKNKDIRYIQVRHEQTAAFMASAYAKLTGHIAACLTVAGPGATNLATGLYDAKLDRAPVLAITGQVERNRIGTGASQEIDQHAFFEPFSVFNMTLISPDQTTNLVTSAIKHALLLGGVAHIDVPRDMQSLECKEKIKPFKDNIPNRSITTDEKHLKRAAEIINTSKKPVIIAGFGSLEAKEQVVRLAEKIDAPIVTTFRGKGVVDENHPLYMGSHGTIGSTAAAELVRDSDLLIVIGSSFSDLTQIPQKRMIQIDIDPMMIARRYPVESGIIGRSAIVIPKILKFVDKKERKDYRKKMSELKSRWLKLLEAEADPISTPIRPQYIISVLNRKLDDDAIITLDVGENGWWFGRNFQMKSTQRVLFSGYLGSMGFGLPAALVAQLEYPERQVACITGDGGFSMVMGDFLTAIKYDLPIKVFLFNNKNLAMIMQEQKVENYPIWQTELQDCDFAGFAENCGGIGIKADDPRELEKVVDEALKFDKPVLVDIDTDPRRFIATD